MPLLKNGLRKLKRLSLGRVLLESVQRYLCPACGLSFSFRLTKLTAIRKRFSQALINRIIRDYLSGHSLSSLEENFQISGTSVLRWLTVSALKLPDCLELNLRLGLRAGNRWSGTLLLDGKWIRTHEGSYVELLAWDFGTGDIVAHLPDRRETKLGYEKLIGLVQASGYRIKALVSDGEPAILALTQGRTEKRKLSRIYPRPSVDRRLVNLGWQPPLLKGVPHQLCCVHVLREVDRTLKYPATRDEHHRRLRKLLRRLLFAPTLKSLAFRKKQLRRWRIQDGQEKQALNKVLRNLPLTSTYLRLRERKDQGARLYLPRSSNGLENGISRIEERLKTMRGFKTLKTAQLTLKLIILNLRFGKMKNSKKKRKNGKSPLTLAGAVNLPKSFLGLR